MSTNRCFVILLLQVVLVVEAVTFLRKGPLPGSSQPVMLRGSTVVNEFTEIGGQGARKRVGWAAMLLRDVVTWYDLEDNQVSFTKCDESEVTLDGQKLDLEDYAKGTVFVVDVDPWERNCNTPAIITGVPEEDDVLFYEITTNPIMKTVEKTVTKRVRVKVPCNTQQSKYNHCFEFKTITFKEKSNSLTFKIKRMAGEDVVPEVDLEVSENDGTPAPDGIEGEIEFANDPAAISTTARNALVEEENLVLPVSERFLNLNESTELSSSVQLEFGIEVSASIRSFRLRRLRGLEFSWTQTLVAGAFVKFEISTSVSAETERRLLERPVPKFGFRSRRIPFVGRARAGAFVRLDAIFEVEAGTTFTAEASIRREIRQDVRASLLRGRVSARNKTPRGANTQSLTIAIGGEASITGFAGVRPALALQASLGRRQAGGNIGVKLGVQFETILSSTPFDPVTDGLVKVGDCDDCHKLQGALFATGKDLTVQSERNNEVTREIVLLEELFKLRLVTFCLIQETCPALPTFPPFTV